MRERFPCHLKEVGVLVNAYECSEKFLFLYENFQIDSNNQTC